MLRAPFVVVWIADSPKVSGIDGTSGRIKLSAHKQIASGIPKHSVIARSAAAGTVITGTQINDVVATETLGPVIAFAGLNYVVANACANTVGIIAPV